MKLLNQGFLEVKFKSSLRKLYGHHHDLFNNPYGITVSEIAIFYICNKSNITGATFGEGAAYPFRGALRFTSGIYVA